MSLQRIPIRIHLHTVIRDEETMDHIKDSFLGTIASNDRMTVITYREKLEGAQYVDTLMTITDEKVNVKRSGTVSMNQSFVEQTSTECLFTHPHGSMHMETYTTELTHEHTNDGGKVLIVYEVQLNGQETRQHELELIYHKEE